MTRDRHDTVGLLLALIVPLLFSVRMPWPIFPDPVMVSLLVRVPPVDPVIKFGPPVPRTTVPVPAKVAELLPLLFTMSSVLLLLDCRLMVPLLVIVPEM